LGVYLTRETYLTVTQRQRLSPNDIAVTLLEKNMLVLDRAITTKEYLHANRSNHGCPACAHPM
jgi:hypothetical protein